VILRRLRWPVAMLAAVLPLVQGCCGQPRPNLNQIRADWKNPDTRGLTLPAFNPDVIAVCDPPIGWKPDALKTGPNHIHEVWLSPSGATAYGVIHFTMPLPIGLNLALSGFLSEMKTTEGEAKLLSREDDANLPGIRFVAEGGLYRIHANLIIDGWDGWTVYAGTFRAKPVAPDEFDTAVRARENTHVGRPENPDR
jgi:hypothetical protein